MEFVHQVQELVAQGFGWLTPKDHILSCPLHRHLEVVRQAGFHRNEIGELDDDLDRVARTYEDCVERDRADEHPEWHHHEMAEGDYRSARYAIVNALYAEGWIRLGTRRQGTNLFVEAEGDRKAIEQRTGTLNDIALFAKVTLSTFTNLDMATSMELDLDKALKAREEGQEADEFSW